MRRASSSDSFIKAIRIRRGCSMRKRPCHRCSTHIFPLQSLNRAEISGAFCSAEVETPARSFVNLPLTEDEKLLVAIWILGMRGMILISFQLRALMHIIFYEAFGFTISETATSSAE